MPRKQRHKDAITEYRAADTRCDPDLPRQRSVTRSVGASSRIAHVCARVWNQSQQNGQFAFSRTACRNNNKNTGQHRHYVSGRPFARVAAPLSNETAVTIHVSVAATAAAAAAASMSSSQRYAKIFRGWVEDTFTPCVAVVASDGAQQSCAVSNLTVTQLLQPFTTIRGHKLQVRMVGQVSTLQSFSLRFVPATEFRPRSVEENERGLARVAAGTKMPLPQSHTESESPARSPRQLSTLLRDCCEYETEWLAAAKSQIFEGQRYVGLFSWCCPAVR